MRIIGCDFPTRQQTLAMLDTATGEVVRMTLTHEGNHVREFYSALPCPVRVGIEATGSMQWFVNLMEELGIECQVGHPAVIRAGRGWAPFTHGAEPVIASRSTCRSSVLSLFRVGSAVQGPTISYASFKDSKLADASGTVGAQPLGDHDRRQFRH